MKYLQESLETGLLNSVHGVLEASGLVAQRCPTPGLQAIADGTSLTFGDATHLLRLSKYRKLLEQYAENLPSKILPLYYASFLTEEGLQKVTPRSTGVEIQGMRKVDGGPIALSLLIFGKQVRFYFGEDTARDKMIASFNSLAPEPITVEDSWTDVNEEVLGALLWGIYGSDVYGAWHTPSGVPVDDVVACINGYLK